MANISPISKFDFVERIKPSNAPQAPDKLELSVPNYLPERRIYAFIDTKTTGAGLVQVYTDIVMFNEGVEIGRIPINYADFNGTAVNASQFSLVNAGGTPVGDSLVLTVAKQLNAAVAQVVLQPFRINAEINRLVLDVKTVRDDGGVLSGYHYYLACVSTKF